MKIKSILYGYFSTPKKGGRPIFPISNSSKKRLFYTIATSPPVLQNLKKCNLESPNFFFKKSLHNRYNQLDQSIVIQFFKVCFCFHTNTSIIFLTNHSNPTRTEKVIGNVFPDER